MSENKIENVKSIQDKFDVDDARKQTPGFFSLFPLAFRKFP